MTLPWSLVLYGRSRSRIRMCMGYVGLQITVLLRLLLANCAHNN